MKLTGGTTVACLLLVMLTAGCASSNRSDDPRQTDAEPQPSVGPSKVTYKVTGSAGAVSITLQTPTGTRQEDISPPLSNKAGGAGLEFMFDPGSFVYIAAQNQGVVGNVTCRIEIGGKVVSENTSAGEYGIAQCYGTS